MSLLTYEPLSEEHADLLHPALTDPRVYEFIAGPFPKTLEELRARFKRMAAGPGPDWPDEEWINFLVRCDGAPIGRIEASRYGERAEVAFLFDPAVWGRGHAREAMVWLQEYLAREKGVREFWGTAEPANSRSWGLMKRLGYSQVLEGWPDLGSYDEGDVVYRLLLR